MKVYYFLVITFFIILNLFAQSKAEYLTDDGAWCWFSDPRAIMVGNDVFTGWVKKNGTIEAVKFDTASKRIITYDLYPELEGDDHIFKIFLYWRCLKRIYRTSLFSWNHKKSKPRFFIKP